MTERNTASGGTGGPPPGGPEGGTGRRRPVAQHLDTDTLNAYLDSRLDAEQTAAAAAHLTTCLDCQRELADLRATVGLLGGLPQYRPRRSFELGPEQLRTIRLSRLARFLPILPVVRTATVAVALLLVAVVVGDVWVGPRTPASAPQSGAVIAPTMATGDVTGTSAGGATSQEQAPAAQAPQVAAGGAGAETAADSAADSAPRPAARRVMAGAPAPVTGSAAAGGTTSAAANAAIAAPTATGAAPAAAVSAATPREPAAGSGPSAWRVAEAVLGLLLVLLAAGWFELRRIGRQVHA